MTASAVQWICSPALPCACNEANPDACGCDETPDIAKACSKCAAPMVLINVDTGEPVEAVAVEHGERP